MPYDSNGNWIDPDTSGGPQGDPNAVYGQYGAANGSDATSPNAVTNAWQRTDDPNQVVRRDANGNVVSTNFGDPLLQSGGTVNGADAQRAQLAGMLGGAENRSAVQIDTRGTNQEH